MSEWCCCCWKHLAGCTEHALQMLSLLGTTQLRHQYPASDLSLVNGVNAPRLQSTPQIGHACFCGQRKPKAGTSQMLAVGSRWCVWKWGWRCQGDLGRTPRAFAILPYSKPECCCAKNALLAPNALIFSFFLSLPYRKHFPSM